MLNFIRKLFYSILTVRIVTVEPQGIGIKHLEVKQWHAIPPFLVPAYVKFVVKTHAKLHNVIYLGYVYSPSITDEVLESLFTKPAGNNPKNSGAIISITEISSKEELTKQDELDKIKDLGAALIEEMPKAMLDNLFSYKKADIDEDHVIVTLSFREEIVKIIKNKNKDTGE